MARTASRSESRPALMHEAPSPARPPYRVLLCDDDAGYRKLVRIVLEDEGVEIVGEVCDGDACVASLAAGDRDPDLILLDLKMAGRSGLEALPDIRACAPHSMVVMLSTALRMEYEAAAVSAGATAVVTKPTDIFSLPARLRSAMSCSRLAT